MAAAIARIVVQVTPQEKKAITAKARKLGLPISELMRRGATAYESAEAGEELGALADAAKAAAERAFASIDESLAFIGASNKRIAAMEAKAAARVTDGTFSCTKLCSTVYATCPACAIHWAIGSAWTLSRAMPRHYSGLR